jgi:hypothetical protein
VPTLTYYYTGLVNGDTSASFTGGLTTTATGVGVVGGYPITQGSLAATGNYSIATFNGGTLTVTPAALTITPAAGQSKVYGAAVPALACTPSGLVNNDPLSTLTGALGTAATAASPVGTYAFTLGTLSAGSNYTVVLATDAPAFAVTPAALTITADNQTKIQGEANPPFTVHYSGFVLGEGPGVLGGTLTLSTPASAGSPPGNYAIMPAGLTSGNYAITFVSGTLTVLSYSQATADLQARVDAAGLAHGLQNALDSKLRAAINSFNRGNTNAGANLLEAFVSQVLGQRGKKIDAALADSLSADARRILDAIGPRPRRVGAPHVPPVSGPPPLPGHGVGFGR